jgi:hypothetical protein
MLSRLHLNFWRKSRAVQILAMFRFCVALLLCVGMAFGQSINTSNWGTVTAPVYNQAESNPNYSSAEILAGPSDLYEEAVKLTSTAAPADNDD